MNQNYQNVERIAKMLFDLAQNKMGDFNELYLESLKEEKERQMGLTNNDATLKALNEEIKRIEQLIAKDKNEEKGSEE